MSELRRHIMMQAQGSYNPEDYTIETYDIRFWNNRLLITSSSGWYAAQYTIPEGSKSVHVILRRSNTSGVAYSGVVSDTESVIHRFANNVIPLEFNVNLPDSSKYIRISRTEYGIIEITFSNVEI